MCIMSASSRKQGRQQRMQNVTAIARVKSACHKAKLIIVDQQLPQYAGAAMSVGAHLMVSYNLGRVLMPRALYC